MIVDKSGKLFENRRNKSDRRKNNEKVEVDRRKEARRKENNKIKK